MKIINEEKTIQFTMKNITEENNLFHCILCLGMFIWAQMLYLEEQWFKGGEGRSQRSCRASVENCLLESWALTYFQTICRWQLLPLLTNFPNIQNQLEIESGRQILGRNEFQVSN